MQGQIPRALDMRSHLCSADYSNDVEGLQIFIYSLTLPDGPSPRPCYDICNVIYTHVRQELT